MTLPKHDTAAAVDFLLRWAPQGPWCLTAISVDKKSISTATFLPGQEAAMHDWTESFNGKRNVYYQVNTVIGLLKKKAERRDIRAVDFLHVDIDPREGENLAEERDRALALLTTKLPPDVPPPTVVVFSGGGFQGFWRLRESIQIDGDAAKADEAALYNMQLETAFNADRCHNVDRLMRLPGTINIPDAKKQAKGRTPTLAKLVEFNERSYPISEFKKETVKDTAASQPPGLTVDRTKVQPLADLGALDKWGVPDRVKVIINLGHDPERPKLHDKSRSPWLFDALCQLARCRVPTEVMFAVITDPAFGISASVLDKGRDSEKYALRQIERATAAAEDDPVIAEINGRYFAALSGAKVRFWREDGPTEITPMDKEAFAFELGDRFVTVKDGDGKPKPIPASKVWQSHPRRRYYPKGFVLDPAADDEGPAYNLWRGFGISAAAGDWSRMQAHIRDVLADGDAVAADYITRWSAWSVQHPATPPRVALVFRGGEGIGKGMFANALVDIFGVHGMRVQHMRHLVGNFNAHLRHLCLLFADEAVAPGSEGEGALKGLITEATIPIEAKGVDVVQAENHLHVVMASNKEWVVPAGADARRFAVFNVSDERKGDKEYFTALAAELATGGLAAMLQDLLALDLGAFHPEHDRPNNAALSEQKAATLQGFERIWLDLLQAGELPTGDLLDSGVVFVGTARLREYAQKRTRAGDVTLTEVGRLFNLFKPHGFAKDRKRRPSGYMVPPLPVARMAWDTKKFKIAWDRSDRWSVAPVGQDHDLLAGRRPF